MLRSCPSCSRTVADDDRFCSSCGMAQGVPDATRTSAPSLAASEPALAPRFATGAMIGGRYRIVGLLGRGGMGEVYRADDLKLARPVALKFLPAEVEHDPGRLVRFLNEVRVALKVSHPNVCRVHDIGETDGRHFISMEYVDGEDLVSLLRRIGHLPQDRATKAARQLCAGLAAAHAQGILHRDLKPANVMIDGRGEVKITDFGLAGLAEEMRGDADVRAGTPAYMAPEQLDGREVTVRSDIFALGLVLYEIFTGEKAFEGGRKRRGDGTPTSMNRLVKELDPAVERVVLRCLATDPSQRPSGALAVAAALPGGDPLAAALAAGETPSPQLLVEAGETGGLTPRWAVSLLALVLGGLALAMAVLPRTSLVSLVPLDQPPEVLAHRAREVIKHIGYDERPNDSIFAFAPNDDYLRHLGGQGGRGRFQVLRNAQPPGLSFWYRQGPVPLIPRSGGSLGEWVEETPLDVPGTFDVTLDTTGRLRSFLAVRPRLRETKGAGGEPDWRPLIESAGFDPAALRAIDPAWSPPVHAERVVAWSARYPDAPAVEVQLHAASLDGRPVWFRIVEPWTRAAEPASMHEGDWARPALVARGACFLFALIGASWMAIRNVKLGRGDQRTALRFAFYLTAVRLLWFVGAHHVVAAEELDVFQAHLAWSLFRFGVLYVFYLALEPYARRLWPTMLVSWVRLFDGRFRDPLVGRDLLAGVFFGVVFPLAFSVVGRFPGLSPIERWSLEALRGWNSALAVLMATHAIAILDVFMVVILLTVLRVLLRRTWLAIGVISVVGYLMFDPGYGQPFDHAVSVAVVLTIFWLVLFRIGLLAAVAALTVDGLLRTMPLGASTSALLALLVVLAIAAWGFWTSLAGRPLFRDELQEAD